MQFSYDILYVYLVCKLTLFETFQNNNLFANKTIFICYPCEGANKNCKNVQKIYATNNFSELYINLININSEGVLGVI